MVKRLILLPFILLILFSQTTLAAEFTASVDRTQITEQETLTLKLRLNEQVFRSQPELKALEKDFKIQGQQRSQQFRSINGTTESFTEWNIGLTPRRTGTLTIPALTFKGVTSQPIKIEVLPISAAVTEQTEQDFFFDIEVTPKIQPLVQGQLLYKEKLYYAENHTEANLSELKVTDARLQPLGEIKHYSTVVNGRRFGVYERNYAIFPETVGELVIPGQQFNATMPNAYDRWSRGRAINIVSKPIKIDVAAIPSSYPSNAAWLPATQLTLTESFSKKPNQWKVGEAVTRTIHIQAQGIPGNQLPDVSLPQITDLRYYPDQAVHDEQVTEQGIIGHTEQSVAIVAAKGGEFTLPEVRIPWWNTQTNKLEYAVLPAHKINVQGGTTLTSPLPLVSDDISAQTTSPSSIAGSKQTTNTPWLLWLALALLCASLVTNVLLLLARKKQPAIIANNTSEQAETPSKKQHWHAFSKACNSNNGIDIRNNLLNWINAGGLATVNIPVTSLTALAKQVRNPMLTNALLELDSMLYSQNSNSAYNGQNLKRLIEEERKRPSDIKENNGLYPEL